MPTPLQLPQVEATSALNFNALTTHVAMKLGIASYGTSGTNIPSAPTDTRNLAICQTIVNDSIRMFLADAPANGWFFSRPVAQVDLWPEVGPDPTGSTYVSSTGYNSSNSTVTLALTVPSPLPSTVSSYPLLYIPNFVQSMEYQTIWLGGQPLPSTLGWYVPPNSPLASSSTYGTPYSIYSFNGPYSISVYVGSSSTLPSTGPSTVAQWDNKIPFGFASQGNYTLPAGFSGQIAGDITFIAQTNRGMILHWTDETIIRTWRQNQNQQQGTPAMAAIRIQNTPDYQQVAFPINDSVFPNWRRRWELLTWRTTSEFLSVLFPYHLAFNNLVNTTDLPPSPIGFDDTILAACRAQAERFMTDSLQGPDWMYYRQVALPNAVKINGRGANRMLGYNGSGKQSMYNMSLSEWRNYWYQRPGVGVVGPYG